MTFGQKLRELREARGLGLREFSRISGLSKSHLHYMERGERQPGDETVARLARHLGVPKRDLLHARDGARLETELTLLLREAGPLSPDERQHLLDIAAKLLEDEPATQRNQ